MPNTGLAEEDSGSRWVTIRGHKVEIKRGQDPEEAIREKFTGIGGLKGQNTRESRGSGHQEHHGVGGEKNPSGAAETNEGSRNEQETKKNYFQRYGIYKSLFRPRDRVTFNKYEQFGLVAGLEGESVRILDKNGEIIYKHKDYVFKVDEMTRYGHWDAMSEEYRAKLLKECNLSDSFLKVDWSYVPEVLKEVLKATSPAGYDNNGTGFNTGVQGRVNPVSNELTVSEKIREEISRRAQQSENTPPKILEGGELGQDKEEMLEGQEASTGELPKDGKFPEVGETGKKPEFDGKDKPSIDGDSPKFKEENEQPVEGENPLEEGKITGKTPTEKKPEPPKEKKNDKE